MVDGWQSSYFLESTLDDRRRSTSSSRNASLNDSLHTEHLDVREADDSWIANVTRRISRIVGMICTPKQVLGVLRILKAITLIFIVLNIFANLIYIVFAELLSSEEVKKLAGGRRDVILRLYGVLISITGLAIELDYSRIVKRYVGLKGFIPRAFLYFFISQLTGSPPVTSRTTYSDNGNQNNDDGDDDAFAASTTVSHIKLPSGIVGFQRSTAFVLGCCALGYLICGLMCLDRFTARAFLSTDPRVSNANQAATHSTTASLEHSGSSAMDGSTADQENSTLGSSQA